MQEQQSKILSSVLQREGIYFLMNLPVELVYLYEYGNFFLRPSKLKFSRDCVRRKAALSADISQNSFSSNFNGGTDQDIFKPFSTIEFDE